MKSIKIIKIKRVLGIPGSDRSNGGRRVCSSTSVRAPDGQDARGSWAFRGFFISFSPLNPTNY